MLNEIKTGDATSITSSQPAQMSSAVPESSFSNNQGCTKQSVSTVPPLMQMLNWGLLVVLQVYPVMRIRHH